MSDANKFLFIGGCADGQRLTVPPGQHMVVVPRKYIPQPPFVGGTLECVETPRDTYEHQYVVFPHVSVFGLRGMDAKRLAKILVEKYPQHEDKTIPSSAAPAPLCDRPHFP